MQNSSAGQAALPLNTIVALNRFGLGGRPDQPITQTPATWLLNQLSGADPAINNGLPGSASVLLTVQAMNNVVSSNPTLHASLAAQLYANLAAEQYAAMQNAIVTALPFRERLVWFWANHFGIMANTATIAGLAGPFVREAIRPNVLGTFAQMLLAVIQHPAMLYNLDNGNSVGPASKTGMSGAGYGINENLGRETLELFTVGATAGYAQADVDAMAMMLTGWSINLNTPPFGFNFRNGCHQPGAQLLMGQSFPQSGQQQGIAALTWLATHPDTYAHLATELVTHFISDNPAAGDIAAVQAALAATGGSLAAAAEALVGLASPWTVAGAKVRSPQDYVVGLLRAVGAANTGTPGKPNDPVASIASLGMPIWQPQFPNGWSDLAADWVSPASLMERGDWVSALVNGYGAGWSIASIEACALGPTLRPQTVAAMNAAPTTAQQLTLLLSSVEFQRR